ncbi:MAG: hypothetical protein RLW61_07635 [Gammaproteobacteria bacterium]
MNTPPELTATSTAGPAATTPARRLPWRLRALRWHRALALAGATTLILWGSSGLLHPLMTSFGPQQKVFYPPRVPLALGDGPEFHDILSAAGITTAQAIRIVAGETSPLLQVTTSGTAERRYFALDTGAELPGHDARQAEFLARHYLDLPPTQAHVENISVVHAFSPTYPAINRLLPVYRVVFDTPDDLVAYVHTETMALAAVDNRFKQGLQTAFQLIHTWSWLPPGAEWLRVLLIALAMLAVLGMATSGVVMLWSLRRGRRAGARRWHRLAGWCLVLPALAFGTSGLYHLLHAAGTAAPTGQHLSPPLATTAIAYPLRAQWPDMTRGLDVTGVSLIEDAAGTLRYRLELAPGAAPPVDPHAIREARFAGLPRTGPALYLDAARGAAWPAGDREFALQLGERFSGLSRSHVTATTLVTRFGPGYDFRNKRLPVWKLDYGAPLHASLFVDTRTGVLADVVVSLDVV